MNDVAVLRTLAVRDRQAGRYRASYDRFTVAIEQAAAVLGDDGVARQAYELMLPFADRPMIASVGVVCLGSTEQALGLAARTFGDLDLAVEHLERATVANVQRRNLPMLTLAKANLATTLLLRDGPGDAERAAGLLAVAVDEAESMGMTRRADEWRAQLPEHPEDQSGPTTGPDDAPPGDLDGSHGVIRKEDGRWTVTLDGHRVRVPDLIGMRYLAELLTRPGQHIPALTLASDGTVAGSSPHEVLDPQARAHYERRARELTEDLAAAEADHDRGRADKLRLEIDALIDELESATGLAGRTRRFADPTERARTAVRKAIKRAIDTLDDANPSLATHLRATVVTGTTCSYTPAPHAPVTWSTS